MTAIFPFATIAKGARIILFGVTEITVDEHPENFDDSVVGLERLKQKDYNAIIICTFPQQAQNATNKIMQIVPDMADRIVYNF